MFQQMKTAASDSMKPGQPEGGKIGYGMPPKDNQFKKGKSGNPKGRKKRPIVKDLRTLFDDILAEEIKIRERGRVRKITTFEAIILAYVNSALGANINSLRRLCGLGERIGMLTKRRRDAHLPYTLVFPRDADEEAILSRHRAEQARLTQAMEARDAIEPAIGTTIRDEKRTGS